jgi:16S rRNA (guanine966-N2)-methyltransferase
VASHDGASANSVKQAKSGNRRASTRGADAGIDARKPRVASRVLRIIGGRHRGRRLRFPTGVEIRPTPDRVRETLFNWLQPRISGARVLDLFAGSGALGLEALSRGAAHVTFVEKDRRAAAAIEALIKEWQEPAATIACADALAWVAASRAEAPFDIVFLDPPYDAAVLATAAASLGTHGRLAPDARIYLERRARESLPELPPGWREQRSGRAGEVGYHLYAS